MKKILLLIMALSITVFAIAQRNYIVKPEFAGTAKTMIVENQTSIDPIKQVPLTSSKFVRPPFQENRDVTIFAIGQAGNAYTYASNVPGCQKTFTWVDNEINTFTNMHREIATAPNYSGNLNIDISTDRGENFTNNVRIYTSTETGGTYNTDAARYPQGAIYNPEGNTTLSNAYYAFFAPCLDASNDATGWGGYAFGTANLVDFTDTTKHLTSSVPADGIFQYIPSGFTVTHQGVALASDCSEDWTTGALVFTNQFIMNRGVWNSASNDFDYERFWIDIVPLPDASARPGPPRVAFAPDGQTGYLVTLEDDGSVPWSVGSMYPIVYRTLDGGETWEDPVGVQLGGPDGIEAIVYDWLTDQQIEDFFVPPAPARDEIIYTTAMDCDLVVDMYGNPHISVMLGIGDGAYGIYILADYIAVFDITSPDGGQTWNAYHCGNLTTWEGDFGDLVEYNRVQASVTEDGSKVFVTWNDTHFEGVTTNTQPDIFIRGIDMQNYLMTEAPVNITEYTVAWLQAYLFAAPHYVFTDGDTYTIPLTYVDMDPADPTQQVTFMFIKDFSYNQSDFTVPISDFTVNAGPNASMCEGGSYSLSGNSIGYASLEWTTSGDGVFDDPTILTPLYTPGPADIAAGSVTLTLTAYNGSGQSISDDMVLTIKAAPVAYAGDPAEICTGETFTNTTATAEHYFSLHWSTSGDGTFDDITILLPIYTPGPNDIVNGSATLTLKAQGIIPCGFVTSDMVLTILPLPGIPGTPSGPDNVDLFYIETSDYSTTGAANSVSYVWDIQPSNAGTIDGTTTTATVTWNVNFLGTALIKVKGVNACGDGEFSGTFEVNVFNSVGIGEIQNNTITISPNPNSGEFILKLGSIENTVIYIRIMDAMGNVIYTENNIPVSQNLDKKITLDKMREGVYLMIIGDGKTTLAKKLIIQK